MSEISDSIRTNGINPIPSTPPAPEMTPEMIGPFPADTVRRARSEHGATNVKALKVSGLNVLVRKPSKLEWERFEGDKRTDDAVRALVEACTVHPDRATMTAFLEDKFAAHMPIGDKLAEMVGLAQAEEVDLP